MKKLVSYVYAAAIIAFTAFNLNFTDPVKGEIADENTPKSCFTAAPASGQGPNNMYCGNCQIQRINPNGSGTCRLW